MSVKDFFYNIGRKLKQLSQFFSTFIKYKDVFFPRLGKGKGYGLCSQFEFDKWYIQQQEFTPLQKLD